VEQQVDVGIEGYQTPYNYGRIGRRAPLSSLSLQRLAGF
jgi:hypothetical protein